MNDLINRQAAIEALQNHYEVRNPKQNAIMDECVMLISNVPSAQSDDYARGYNDAKREVALSGEYERAYQRGKEDAQQWIPCSERLPDGRLNKSYLVQDKDGRRAVGTYTNWGWVFGHYMNDPVAWMPLPEPWKEKPNEIH